MYSVGWWDALSGRTSLVHQPKKKPPPRRRRGLAPRYPRVRVPLNYGEEFIVDRSVNLAVRHRLRQVTVLLMAASLAVLGTALSAAQPANAVARTVATNSVKGENFENATDLNTCLDANSNGYPANGDVIQLWSCTTAPEQEWVLNSSGQLQSASNPSWCLDANSTDYPNEGDAVQLWGCIANPRQEWVLTSSGLLESAGDHSMCLDANSNDYPNDGDGMQLWACGANSRQLWRLDWANASFCGRYSGVPYMGTTYDGVAACGTAYSSAKSNEQGAISYNGVQFDSVGFQCVELAARYFYYLTGHIPPDADGDFYAWSIYSKYHQYGIYPAGVDGAATSYQSTLVPGDIISMWSSSDLTGHVAIVTSINLQSGRIGVIDENASGSGTDYISVSPNGKMTFPGGLDEFQWVYNLP